MAAMHTAPAFRTWAVVITLLPLLAPVPLAAQTTRYVALVHDGARAGHMVVTRGPDGAVEVDYIFKDNGRGPELTERFTLADDGTFLTYEVKGASTFGGPVDESFMRGGTLARWRSTSDEGSLELTGPAHYTPLGGTPEMYSVALRALAARPDGRLPLIPSGTLTGRAVAVTAVRNGASERAVQLMMLTGVGLAPAFVWATTGDAPRLFALIIPGWMRIVEEGWEANLDALAQRQKEAEAQALLDFRQRLARPIPGATLIRNARPFDSERGTLGAAADVLIRDGFIVSVVPAGTGQGADRIIDAGGRVLLPGLVDSHGHTSAWEGGLHVAAGVTTVRDMGNDNAVLRELIADVEADRVLAPRIVPTGFLEGESPFSARIGFVISTLDEAKDAIDWYADHGYHQIKIYNSFPRAVLPQAVAHAHSRGLRVSGHVPAFMRAREVVEAGYDELQHINQVLLNFLVTDTTDTRTLERFRLVAERTADLDLDGPDVQAFIALLAERRTVVDPTLATFDFLRHRSGHLSEAFAAVADHLPPDVRRSLYVGDMDIPDDATAERYERSYQKLVEFVGRMHAAGVPIVAGTDWTAGFTLHRELELYVQAGMRPGEALQTATWNGARYAGVLGDRGSIEEGKRADLVLVDGDPTTNIADVRRTVLVIRGDVAYRPAELYEALGIRPFATPLPASMPAPTSTAKVASGYRQPPDLGDGWATGHAREAGFDIQALEAMTSAIRHGEEHPNFHSVLIARDGRLVYEEYFAGEDERRGRSLGHVQFDAGTLHDIRSVSKAVVAALVGIAIEHGIIASVDQPILDFFPEHADLATPEKRRITLRHALTMTAGLRWDEETFPYTDPRNDETGMDRSDDPIRYVLSRPMVAEPGATFNYSGGLTHLLAAVVQRTSGRPLLEYAREVLFEPLGIREVEWVGSLGDLPAAASGVRLRPRDLAKFGSLYLHEGRWQGRQIVSAAWVRESTTRLARTDSTEHYGYQQWFIDRYVIGDRSVEVFAAEGNGGQRIYVVPELRMMVTVNAGNYNRWDPLLRPERLFRERILPAALDQVDGRAFEVSASADAGSSASSPPRSP